VGDFPHALAPLVAVDVPPAHPQVLLLAVLDDAVEGLEVDLAETDVALDLDERLAHHVVVREVVLQGVLGEGHEAVGSADVGAVVGGGVVPEHRAVQFRHQPVLRPQIAAALVVDLLPRQQGVETRIELAHLDSGPQIAVERHVDAADPGLLIVAQGLAALP
jgi:hypothetical protein